MHDFNPNFWEAETGGFMISRVALSRELVPGQLGSCYTKRNLISKNQKRKQTNKTR